MAIKTKYPVTIEIDDKSFSVSVSQQVTSSQESELKEVFTQNRENFEKIDSLQNPLNELLEEFDINKLILKHGTVVEKVSVMFEQKSLNKKIFQLQKEIAELDRDSLSLSKAMEKLYEKRFDLLVSGADKLKLKEEANSIGLSYQALFNEFAKEIQEVEEKK